MSGSARMMTPGQARDLAATLAQSTLSDLTFEQAEALISKKGHLHHLVREVQWSLVPPFHADIRIEFELGGRMAEAVGFLREGEIQLPGREALLRVDNGFPISSNEDWECLRRHQGKLPSFLDGYDLHTARKEPDNPNYVSILQLDGVSPSNRIHYYRSLPGNWDRRALIVRWRD